MLYFFHSQYLLPSAAEVSREAFQMSHRFVILLLLDNWGKQKITALHSLNIYFCQITSSFISTNHCPLQESHSCLWYTLRGKILLKRKDFPPSGRKDHIALCHRERISCFIPATLPEQHFELKALMAPENL